MDAGALVIAGFVGCALTGVAVGCVTWIRRLNTRLAAMDRLVEQLTKNTKSIDPVISAIDSQRDFQLMMIGLGDLIDYAARVSPGGTKQLIKDRAPQLFEDRVA